MLKERDFKQLSLTFQALWKTELVLKIKYLHAFVF